jgi:hemerythrin superfamily protein
MFDIFRNLNIVSSIITTVLLKCSIITVKWQYTKEWLRRATKVVVNHKPFIEKTLFPDVLLLKLENHQ